jgi:hemerythrin superfamily protein
MDAITLLKDDHKSVEKLFKRFDKAGDEAFVEKRRIVDSIVEELSIHAAVEEQFFYPVVRATVPDTDDLALESLEEHHIVKWVLDELDGMDPHDERFDAKVTVLIENVRHHVTEEESELFPKVRDELGRAALAELGDALEQAKQVAPTHPHPRSPDTPPANVIVGAAAGVADRITDTVSGVHQGGTQALSDLVARVLGRKRPSRSAVGSSRARTTAEKVRSGASDATEAVTEAVRDAEQKVRDVGSAAGDGARSTAKSARRTASSTAKTAKSGAKATTTSARRGGRRVETTAKRSATSTARKARTGARSTARTAKKAASRTTKAARGSSS